MEMDLCGPVSFLPEDSDLLLDPCQPLLLDQCSDAGYHSACSSSILSPTSSVDSCCLSPPAASLFGGVQEIQECFRFLGDSVSASSASAAAAAALEPVQESRPVRRGRKPRSKYPGKKRQSASEREKLRMRDLTKALHHLRTYLPASVAPAGQTLTKIETLRLTIRYIAHLSDQLELSEETLVQRGPASDHHPQQRHLQASSPLLHPASDHHHQQRHLPASSPLLHPASDHYHQQQHTQQPQSALYRPSTPQHQQQQQQPHLQASPQGQQPQTGNFHFKLQQLQQLQPHNYSPGQEAHPAHASPLRGSPLPGYPLQHLPELTHSSCQNPCDIITYAQDVCSIPQEYWAPPQNMFFGLC